MADGKKLPGYIRPDFSEETSGDTTIASFFNKGKGQALTSEIDGYMTFSIIRKQPLLEKHKIYEDKLVLATLSDGKVLYVDNQGNLNQHEDKIVSLKKAEALPEIHIPDINATEMATQIPDIATPEISATEIILPEIEVPDILSVKEEIKKTVGYNIIEAKITPHIWMKILALSAIDYKPKIKPMSDIQYGGAYFWIGDKAYIVTNVNPFEKKEVIDMYIYADNNTILENIYSIVQSKILGYKIKQPVQFLIPSDNLNDFATPDSNEPLTNIPYKLIDETVFEIWKLQSREELSELISLSKKYGCGCGSI